MIASLWALWAGVYIVLCPIVSRMVNQVRSAFMFSRVDWGGNGIRQYMYGLDHFLGDFDIVE